MIVKKKELIFYVMHCMMLVMALGVWSVLLLVVIEKHLAHIIDVFLVAFELVIRLIELM